MRFDFLYENLMDKHISTAGNRARLFPGAEQAEKPVKGELARLKWMFAQVTAAKGRGHSHPPAPLPQH